MTPPVELGQVWRPTRTRHSLHILEVHDDDTVTADRVSEGGASRGTHRYSVKTVQTDYRYSGRVRVTANEGKINTGACE